MNTSLDNKIIAMLRQLDDAAPTAPAFDDLIATAGAGGAGVNRSGPNWVMIGAAASIVAVGVVGLASMTSRDSESAVNLPAASIPGDASEPALEPQPIGLAGPLIGTGLAADTLPLFEVDQPNWQKDYVSGTDELPIGDLDMDMMVFVGDGGPTFDQPLVSISTYDVSNFNPSAFGTPVDVGGAVGAVNVEETDADTKLVGPSVNLTVPIDDSRALRVNTVRLGVDETIAIAAMVEVTDGGLDAPTPAGFRRLADSTPSSVRHLSYQWVFDDGAPVPEPVVISSPGASEVIDLQPSIEVVGQNLAAVSLMGRIGLQVGENRVINDVDIAYRPLPDQPGNYWADWLDGDWSFYAMGNNLDSEAQFIELLESLTIVDAETFATADSELAVTLPGRHDDLALDILGDLGLADEQFGDAATTAMVTGAYDYRFELYFGLGCVARNRWLAADVAGDGVSQAAALAIVQAANDRPDDEYGLPSNVGLFALVESMTADDAATVAEFGSNDCPLWSN